MFYSTDILTRREGGFGLFWLVSTLGSKGGTSFKKLTRKEVLGADLVKACKRLADPEEPFALRLSSNILSGISRVYQQQYTLYQSDVTTMHQSLKKAFVDNFAKSLLASKSIELPTPNASTAAAQAGVSGVGGGGVTLAIDPTLAAMGWDLDWDLSTDWEKMLIGNGDAKVEEGWEGDFNFSSGVEEDLQVKRIRRQPTGAHTVHDKASITLQEPHLDDYLLQDEHSLVLDGDFGADYGLEEYGDIGLLEGLSPRLDAAIRASSAGAGSRQSRGGRGVNAFASSSGVGGAEAQDLGGYDDFFGGMDFGGGEEETLEERVRREHLEGLEQGNITGKAVRGSSEDRMDIDGSEIDFAHKRKTYENDEAEAAQIAAKKVKRIVSKKALIDSTINLTLDQVNLSRGNYDERMVNQRERIEKTQAKKDDHGKGIALIYGVPNAFAMAPELAALWTRNITDHMPAPGKNQPTGDRKNFRNTKPEDDGSPQHGRSGAILDQYGGQEGNLGMGEEFDFGEFGGGGKDGEEEKDMGGFDDFGYLDAEIEQGRGDDSGNLIASQRNADLPWNRPSDIGMGDFDVLQGAASSQTGTNLGGVGRISMDTPVALLNRKRSRSGSLMPSLLNSKSPIGGRRASRMLDEGVGDFEGMEIEDAAEEEVNATQEAQRALATLERESLNFLAYAKRQASNDTSDFLFSDIVPIASTNESAAAQALYHLLALASKSLLKVHQREAYGDIHIELVQGV